MCCTVSGLVRNCDWQPELNPNFQKDVYAHRTHTVHYVVVYGHCAVTNNKQMKNKNLEVMQLHAYEYPSACWIAKERSSSFITTAEGVGRWMERHANHRVCNPPLEMGAPTGGKGRRQ